MRTVAVAAALAALAWFTTDDAHACAISLIDGGELALNAEHNQLTSEPAGAATITTVIPSLTSVVIEVSAPTRIAQPPLYEPAGETVQVRYDASVLGLIHLKTQGWSGAATSFSSGILGLGALTVTMTVHNRIVNNGGFAAGSYGTRTIVTCHP
jgi:hypothetical protein